MVLYALSEFSMRGVVAGGRDQSHSTGLSINIRRTRSQKRAREPLLQRLYSAYCLVLFTALGLTALTVNLFLPGLRGAPPGGGRFLALVLRHRGHPVARSRDWSGLPQAPCVVVANHASYIDGIVAAAALPPDFAFVIKKEMVRVPLASLLLRRLGSAFVERFDRHKGGADTRRVWKLAATGQSLVFFPEGTFDDDAPGGPVSGRRLRDGRAVRACRSWRWRSTAPATCCRPAAS